MREYMQQAKISSPSKCTDSVDFRCTGVLPLVQNWFFTTQRTSQISSLTYIPVLWEQGCCSTYLFSEKKPRQKTIVCLRNEIFFSVDFSMDFLESEEIIFNPWIEYLWIAVHFIDPNCNIKFGQVSNAFCPYGTSVASWLLNCHMWQEQVWRSQYPYLTGANSPSHRCHRERRCRRQRLADE